VPANSNENKFNAWIESSRRPIFWTCRGCTMSNEVGFTQPRQARDEWEQRERRKRLELMAEFKKASDRHA
jgi:hypothetical protein